MQLLYSSQCEPNRGRFVCKVAKKAALGLAAGGSAVVGNHRFLRRKNATPQDRPKKNAAKGHNSEKGGPLSPEKHSSLITASPNFARSPPHPPARLKAVWPVSCSRRRIIARPPLPTSFSSSTAACDQPAP